MGESLDSVRHHAQTNSADASAKMLDEVRVAQVAAPNDTFKRMTDEQLEANTAIKHEGDSAKIATVRGSFEELLRRHDARFTEAHHAETLPKMALLMECIKQGKGLKVSPNGGYEIDKTKPLSEQDRYRYHKAIIETTGLMNNPIRIRQDYVTFLRSIKQYADAVKVAEAESAKAQLLMKEVPFGNGKVRMMDLLLEEQSRLLTDQMLISSPIGRHNMGIAANFLVGNAAGDGNKSDRGIINAPVNADKQLVYLYLGTDLAVRYNEKGEPVQTEGTKFGMNTGFKPDLAMQAAMRARDTLQYISKNDPTTAQFGENNPGHVSLFGMEYKNIPNGKALNIFLDANKNGKPDLLEDVTVEKLNTKIRETTQSASMLTDVATTAVAFGMLAFTKNARLAAATESVVAKVAPAARFAAEHPQLAAAFSNTARYAAVGGAAVPVRHYGYQFMTGGTETWVDSMVHTGGSVLAAELGSRVAGRATPAADNGGIISKPFNMSKMDAPASAQLFAREGYNTTGKVAEMLKRSGYTAEAKAFEALPGNTAITSQAAVDAIKAADLTYGRLTTVSKALLEDKGTIAKIIRKAKGDEEKMAKRGLTADMIPESMPLSTPKTSIISRMKDNVTDRLQVTPLDPSKTTATEIVRARTSTNVQSAFVTSATYNSIVTAYDLQGSINGATGKPFTYLEAVSEANFPTFKGEEKWNWPERYAIRAFLGLPGQVLVGAPMAGSGAMYKSVFAKTGDLWASTAHGVPYKVLRTMAWAPGQAMHTISPFSSTARKNVGSLIFNNSTLGPTKTLLGNRFWPMAESLTDRYKSEAGKTIDTNVEYGEMLKRAAQPIENGK